MQDKINAFWEITKKELEDRKAEMRNQDRQTEEAEDMHQRELKVGTSVSGYRDSREGRKKKQPVSDMACCSWPGRGC